jgi:hypothetical protein
MALSKLNHKSFVDTVEGNPSLIINGDMAVSQRGSVSAIQTAYTACDRFGVSGNGTAARFDSSQSTDVPSGQGFTNSLKLDVSTADTSISAGDFALVYQSIEAQNLQHLKYGTSSAEKCTLSFWVKSPKTGTHILEIFHNDASYSNSHQYSITTANTWQKVEITFDGYQTTAIDNNNEAGLGVYFWLVAGSTYSGGTHNENTWHNTTANRAVGQVNVADSTSNDFYLTGIKLEVGSLATPYRHESYAENLTKCQRYYYRITGGVTYQRFMGIQTPSTTNGQGTLNLPTEMRALPTIDNTGTASNYAFWRNNSVSVCSGLPTVGTAGSNNQAVQITATSSSLTAGQAGDFIGNNNTSVFLGFNAEL